MRTDILRLKGKEPYDKSEFETVKTNKRYQVESVFSGDFNILEALLDSMGLDFIPFF